MFNGHCVLDCKLVEQLQWRIADTPIMLVLIWMNAFVALKYTDSTWCYSLAYKMYYSSSITSLNMPPYKSQNSLQIKVALILLIRLNRSLKVYAYCALSLLWVGSRQNNRVAAQVKYNLNLFLCVLSLQPRTKLKR